MKEDSRFEKFRSDCEFYVGRVLGRPMSPPENIYVVATNSCNLHCRFCSIWKAMPKMNNPTLLYKKIVDDSAKMKIPHIILSGGEPLLREDIFEIIDYAKAIGIPQISIITNGTLINDEIAQKLAHSKISHVTISIDGLEKSHDYIRGKGNFKKAINAIRILKKQKNRKFTIGINCVIHNKNLEEIIPLVKLAKKLGCNIFVLQPMLSDNIDMHKRFLDDELWVTNERFPVLEKVITSLIEMKKKDEFKDLIFVDEITLKNIKDYFSGSLRRDNVKCYDGYIRIVVNPLGGTWMCDADYGNLRIDSLNEAWTGKKACSLRRKIKKCDKPCLQACVLRPDLDSLSIITKNFITQLKCQEDNELLKKAVSFLDSEEKIIKHEARRIFTALNRQRNNELKITLGEILECKKTFETHIR
jgi:MoaA/NifB/PqqE/SkfB family radical SAM enzyme